MAELREHILRTPGQLLFPGRRGTLLSNNKLNDWYRELANEAGIPVITSHGARHTSGSTYAMMGVGQKAIATLLGHADVGSTAKYTHVQNAQVAPFVNARWQWLRESAATESE